MEEVWGPWGRGSQGLSLFGVKIQCEGDPTGCSSHRRRRHALPPEVLTEAGL